MASFLYFIPGGTEQSAAEDVERVGLGYALAMDSDSEDVFRAHVPSGPGDEAGIVLRQGQGASYRPDRQVWQMYETLGYAVGYDPEDRPTPEDLERPKTVGFYALTLGDGREWLLPTAAGEEEDYCPLPKKREIDPETGEIQRRPMERFDQLRLYADEIREAVKLSNEDAVDVDRETEIVLEALGTNYRVGICEASLLELLTDDAVRLIIWALIDRWEWTDAQQMMAEEAEEGDDG